MTDHGIYYTIRCGIWLLTIFRIPYIHFQHENFFSVVTNKINVFGVKNKIKAEFEKFWKLSICNKQSKKGNNKLRTYCNFKSHFIFENYVGKFPLSERVNYTKFRISAHTLAIETGRHTRPITSVENRICRYCESNETEDESHALLRCIKYMDKRNDIFGAITVICQNFAYLSAQDKLVYLMNSDDEVLTNCMDLINHIF